MLGASRWLEPMAIGSAIAVASARAPTTDQPRAVSRLLIAGPFCSRRHCPRRPVGPPNGGRAQPDQSELARRPANRVIVRAGFMGMLRRRGALLFVVLGALAPATAH